MDASLLLAVKRKAMQKTKPSKPPTPSNAVPPTQLRMGADKEKGLVLDDMLATLETTRKAYTLREATFGLKEIESQAGAKSAVERIITRSLACHSSDIYTKPHPLLKGIYNIRRGRRINIPKIYSGWRIPPNQAPKVLRVLLERALQTIVQLPTKDPRSKDGSRELRLLALHCDKLAQEIESVVKANEVHKRASVYFRKTKGPGLVQLSRQAEELRRTAETIRAILRNRRPVKARKDSPNPQIRMALYVVGWLEASGGKKQYTPFKRLLSAAFVASKEMETPAWVHRLEIEMTRRKARRKVWAASITV
jgi:hypothetical protein